MVGAVLRGWAVLLLASASALALLWLDRPLLALIAAGAAGVVSSRFVRPPGLSAPAMLVLPVIVATLQIGLFDTRLALTGSAVVVTDGLMVRTDLMRMETRRRGSGPNRQTVRLQAAPVVPAGWTPADPVPFWAVRTIAMPDRQPPAGERDWREPVSRTLLAPAFGTGRMPALIAELAAQHGLPHPAAPVLIRWMADAETHLAVRRIALLWPLLGGMAVWAAALGMAAAMAARRRRPPQRRA